MAEFQRERFAVINPALLAVAQHEPPPVPRLWDERTKGASKETDHAVNLLWLLAFSRRQLRIQVGAYDAQQADEIRLIVKAILRIDAPVNRFLNQVIDVQRDRIINRRTDSVCEILTADKFGSHGARPDVVLINELTHQSDAGFAETLLDNLDKMPNGLGIIVTNSGFDPSRQLNWKRTFAASDRWRILEYNRPVPRVSKASLAESRARNSTGRFARLWQGQWVSDTGDALDQSDIDSCVTQTGPMNGEERGFVFVGGLDIGIRKHATGFVILGKHVGYVREKRKRQRLSRSQRALIDAGLADAPEDEYEETYIELTHRLRLARLRVWKPKPGKRVSLEAVKAAIIDAHNHFNLAAVALDPHQGEMLAELLQREGIPVVLTPQTPASLQEQATALIECFQERTIELYPDNDLRADLRALRIKDTGLKVRLISPERIKDDGAGTAHGDLASALSFAVALAKSEIDIAISFPGRRMIAYP